MDSRLAAAPFVITPATRWRGDGDGGEHIEQFLAEDGSRAKVTAKPSTPRSDHADRENPYVGSDRIALNLRAVRRSIAPAINRAESAVWSISPAIGHYFRSCWP